VVNRSYNSKYSVWLVDARLGKVGGLEACLPLCEMTHQHRGHIRNEVVPQRSERPSLRRECSDEVLGRVSIRSQLTFAGSFAALCKQIGVGERGFQNLLHRVVVCGESVPQHRNFMSARIVNFETRRFKQGRRLGSTQIQGRNIIGNRECMLRPAISSRDVQQILAISSGTDTLHPASPPQNPLGEGCKKMATRGRPYFKVFPDRAGEYRWTLHAANHEPVATSEGYTTQYSARQSAEKVQTWAKDADIE
jgi:uncharacterized protein